MRSLMRTENLNPGGKGNCQSNCKVNKEIATINDSAQIRKYDLVHRPVPVQNDHGYCKYPNMANLSELRKEAVSYIAGYVAKMADKLIVMPVQNHLAPKMLHLRV